MADAPPTVDVPTAGMADAVPTAGRTAAVDLVVDALV